MALDRLGLLHATKVRLRPAVARAFLLDGDRIKSSAAKVSERAFTRRADGRVLGLERMISLHVHPVVARRASAQAAERTLLTGLSYGRSATFTTGSPRFHRAFFRRALTIGSSHVEHGPDPNIG